MSNRGYRPPSRPSSADGWRQGNGYYGRRENHQSSNRPPLSPGAHFYQQGNPYRGSSPALDYGASGGGYPELQYGEAPASVAPRSEVEDYEERDLGEIANQNQARQEREWRQGPEAGVPYGENNYYHQSNEWGQQQHYPPPRSSYSSPPPNATRHHSLEVGSVYGYYSEPPQPSAEYYYGGPVPGPASIASSGRTLGSGNGNGRFPPRRPSSQPPSSTPYSSRDEAPPRFFDVNAPHHSPGNRRSLPLGAGGGAMSRDPHPYASGGEGNDMYGDPLPAFPSWSRTW